MTAKMSNNNEEKNWVENVRLGEGDGWGEKGKEFISPLAILGSMLYNELD